MHARSALQVLAIGWLVASVASAQSITMLEGPVELLWEARVDGLLEQKDTPAVTARAGSLVIAAGSSGISENDLHLVAFDTASSAVAWSFVWPGGGQHEGATALAVSEAQGRVFVGGYSRPAPKELGTAGHAVLVALDLASGTELWSLMIAGGVLPNFIEVNALALAPDGGALYAAFGPNPDALTGAFAAPNGGQLARFDAATGAQAWKMPASGARALAVSPDGAWIYSGGGTFAGTLSVGFSSTFTLRRNNAATGAASWQVNYELGIPDFSGARALALSADGGTLFAAGGAVSKQIVAASAATGAELWSVAAPGFEVERLALTPDGTTLVASGTEADSIRTDALTAGGALIWSSPIGSGVDARDLALDPVDQAAYVAGSGVVLLTGDSYWLVARLSLASGALSWSRELFAGRGVADELAGIELAPGSGAVQAVGSRTALTSLEAGLVSLSASTGQTLQTILTGEEKSSDQSLVETALDPTGARLYLAGSSGELDDPIFEPRRGFVAAVDTAAAAAAWTHAIEPPSADATTDASSLALDSAGGRVFAAGAYGYGHYVVALDAASGSELWLATEDWSTYYFEQTFDLAVAPSAGVVAVATSDWSGAVHLHGRDATTGALLWTRSIDPMHGSHPPSVVASPDGSRFYAVGTSAGAFSYQQDPLIAAIDAATGNPLWFYFHDFTGVQESWDHDDAGALAVSPDGTRLFVSGLSTIAPYDAAVWTMAIDTTTGAIQWTHFETDPAGLSFTDRGLAVSPDGSRVYGLCRLIVGSWPDATEDWHVWALDAASGNPLWSATPTSAAASERAHSLAVDRDGSKLYVIGATRPTVATTDDDVLTQALDSDTGTVLWSATVSSAPEEGDLGRMVALTPDGRIALAASEGFAEATGRDFLVQAFALPALTGFPDEVSLSGGGTHSFDLSGGAAHAGEIGWLLGSASGTSPGILHAGFTLPLNFDAYFLHTLNHPNLPPLSGSLGLLDAAGHKEATFSVPPPSDPSLAGVVVRHAWFGLQGSTLTMTSNAVPVTLVP